MYLNLGEERKDSRGEWSIENDFFIRMIIYVYIYNKVISICEKIKVRKLQNYYRTQKDKIESETSKSIAVFNSERVENILKLVANNIQSLDLRMRGDINYCIKAI